MARDRQWVVLDRSRTDNRSREPAARELLEGDSRARREEALHDPPERPERLASGA